MGCLSEGWRQLGPVDAGQAWQGRQATSRAEGEMGPRQAHQLASLGQLLLLPGTVGRALRTWALVGLEVGMLDCTCSSCAVSATASRCVPLVASADKASPTPTVSGPLLVSCRGVEQQDGLTACFACQLHVPHPPQQKLLTAGMAASTCLTALQNLGSLGEQGKNAGDGRLGRGRLPSLHQSRLRVGPSFPLPGKAACPRPLHAMLPATGVATQPGLAGRTAFNKVAGPSAASCGSSERLTVCMRTAPPLSCRPAGRPCVRMRPDHAKVCQ